MGTGLEGGGLSRRRGGHKYVRKESIDVGPEGKKGDGKGGKRGRVWVKLGSISTLLCCVCVCVCVRVCVCVCFLYKKISTHIDVHGNT